MWSRRESYNDYPNDEDVERPSPSRLRGGKASRVDAEHRTLESFNERKQWDPTSAPKAASGDNVDYDWDRRTRGRNDRVMYDSWAQKNENLDEFYDEDEYEDEDEDGDEDEDEYEDEDYIEEVAEGVDNRSNWRGDIKVDRARRLDENAGGGIFTSMSWRDEELALAPRSYVRNNHTEELHERGKERLRPREDNELQKQMAQREWERKGRPDNIHVVCVDETGDSERAFKFAIDNLPRDHRLVLAHGLYEGLLGHNRADEARMRRVRNKYLQACSDLGRDCTFRHFHFTSSGNFGEEVCDLAGRAHAKSVLVGKRANVSDVRRTLGGSSSRSVLNSCRIPVSVVAKGGRDLASTGNW